MLLVNSATYSYTTLTPGLITLSPIPVRLPKKARSRSRALQRKGQVVAVEAGNHQHLYWSHRPGRLLLACWNQHTYL